ncbi:UDP-glucuronate 4-epimerase [Lewinella aquimaris]|uniref:UDP-glucuronate 4-epimerase n=1 Tax=Neolewinella aquimaris TaxID=1835722 RepID=A0A840E4Y3_9BACT|nr:NAD-dependent epimerase [Neolewinella aquimaris]MBB4080241.1 UDP-glucuronate 4-epimerase [Neolewinella aquimaris]
MILITGTAGFIGFHLSQRLLRDGEEVVGLDVINDYYDINVKYSRLAEAGIDKNEIEYGKLVQSTTQPGYRFIKLDLTDRESLNQLFEAEKFATVVNLAAQAGVRYSLINPQAYIDSNIIGFTNILEACRHHVVKHLAYASSSSVYGLNEKMPLSTGDNVDHPISLYAASKKSNELMAHTYSHLFGLATTGLRFFTVYGPWGRPDMALFLFTEAILKGEPIKVFNHGNMVRDFTYVDDIVEGIKRVIENPPKGNPEWTGESPDPSTSKAPYKVYNIGNNDPVTLMDFILAIEEELGQKAEKNMMDLQPGDVPATYADVQDLMDDLGYKPETHIRHGIRNFLDWYREYYGYVTDQGADAGAITDQKKQ